MDISCSIAVSRFNDGACTLFSLSQRIELTIYFCRFCRHVLRKRDRLCLYKLKYRSSEHGKMLRRKVRKKRKGIQDRDKEGVGPLYMPGRFDCEPGPSSTCKRAI